MLFNFYNCPLSNYKYFYQEAQLRYYKPKGYCKIFKFYFKTMDMYALPITLRYKN